jgi:nucleotide-binding universal stress UspA family protein
MLRTILVGLDGSEDCSRAVELALAWAKPRDARVVGFTVVDEPGILASEAILTGEGDVSPVDPSLASEARRRVHDLMASFQRRADAAGVRNDKLMAFGTPHERFVGEAHRFDIVVLGKKTHFEFGWRNGSDPTLERVVQDCARPVVVVPSSGDASGTGPIIVAFDGSAHASRALAAFEGLGLATSRIVQVVSVDRERPAAERTAARAVEFLRYHDVDARPLPFDGEFPALEAILGATLELSASLLVMGAYGHSQLRELLLGSTTRTVLARSTVPVFCAR